MKLSKLNGRSPGRAPLPSWMEKCANFTNRIEANKERSVSLVPILGRLEGENYEWKCAFMHLNSLVPNLSSQQDSMLLEAPRMNSNKIVENT